MVTLQQGCTHYQDDEDPAGKLLRSSDSSYWNQTEDEANIVQCALQTKTLLPR